MSTPPLGTTASRDPGRVLPTGEPIGRYTSYLDAQKAVDYLADNKFAVQKVAIIGNDLKTVERVTGRLTYPRVALSSALSGAWFGLFVGLILSLFAGSESGITISSSIALGAIFWVLFGVITYAFQRGKRDFTSTSQVVATSYDVIVDPSLAGEARRLLQKLPMKGQAQHPGGAPGSWGQGPSHPSPTSAPGQAQHPGAAPERPASWNDPYAAPRSPAGGADTSAQQQAPGTGEGAGAAGAPSGDGTTAGPGSTGPRRGQFPDLPDGRPQYGVRVDDAAAPTHAGAQPEDGTGRARVGTDDGSGHGGTNDDAHHGSSAADGTPRP